MMKRLLKNKLGITLLEGLIALGLLSLAATATFGVLLSISRKSSRSDIHEEMLWAVERAHQGLQMYNGMSDSDIASLTTGSGGLCGGDTTPLANGTHTINCMLPVICDRNSPEAGRNSSFTYTVSEENLYGVENALAVQIPEDTSTSGVLPLLTRKQIQFDIQCNGFTL